MQKRERQNAVLSLIDKLLVASQAELASRLCEQGYNVTQASVSRDLDEVGVVKLNGYYAIPRMSGSESELGSISLDTAGDNLVVVRCASALTSAIPVKIYPAEISELIG